MIDEAAIVSPPPLGRQRQARVPSSGWRIHALLYLSPQPLTAEEIAETLSVARSNVSNSLRELQGWKIVKIVHVLGDRRDHFQSMKDVWEMFRIILDERKKRETDPTLVI